MKTWLVPFNLQLFAEGDPSPEPTGVEPGAESSSPEPGAADPQPDQKLDKAFAARLGHEKRRFEQEYGPYKSVIEKQAKAAGMEPAEYLKHLEEQMTQEELEAEAAKLGKTPEEVRLIKEKEAIEAKANAYERKERLTAEEKELTSDPKIGKFVTDNLDRLREIADLAEVDLKSAFAIVAAEKLPEILEQTNPEVHIKNYLESLKKGGKPIEIGGGVTTPTPTTPKTFDEARASALEKLKRSD